MRNMSNNGEREQWGSRIGFILAAAGSAVGLGNIWRFPYITGQYGGAAFVFLYVALVFVIGFSVMLAEIAIGRRAQLNAVGSFKKLKGGAWPLVGWMGVAAGFIILSYYAVIGGWTIKYFIITWTGLMEAGAARKLEMYLAVLLRTRHRSFYTRPFSCWLPYGLFIAALARVLKSTAKS